MAVVGMTVALTNCPRKNIDETEPDIIACVGHQVAQAAAMRYMSPKDCMALYNTSVKHQELVDKSYGVIHNDGEKDCNEGHTGKGRQLYQECCRDFGAYNGKEPTSNSRFSS